MRSAYDVATVRAAEEALMARVGDGELMQRAATGLARTCAGLLAAGGGVTGSRVALLVGSGNNGGDALWAGSFLARRGAAVTAVLLSDRVHPEGLGALRAAGGRALAPGDGAGPEVVRSADLVLDGVVGIGGTGALRPAAAELAAAALAGGALRVAVDVPSGVSADTGAVADPDAVFVADATVTFGCLKPGLLLTPGRAYVGVLELIDIGLRPWLPADATARVLDVADVAALLPQPGPADHKYTRGVVGVLAGSARYRGAAFLATGAARHGDAGMVRYLDRGDGIAAAVVDAFPDVVAQTETPTADPRVTAWGCGPGMGESDGDRDALVAALGTAGPVVVDADGLRLLAVADGPVRAAVDARAADGRVTVLTPHDGEFARLGFSAGSGADEDRLTAARRAADEFGCVVLLKGSGTVVAALGGPAYVDPLGPPALATAGSGDVLTGLMAALLSGAQARGVLAADPAGPVTAAARVAAAAAYVHGWAAAQAADGGRPVTAVDVREALPGAIAAIRTGG